MSKILYNLIDYNKHCQVSEPKWKKRVAFGDGLAVVKCVISHVLLAGKNVSEFLEKGFCPILRKLVFSVIFLDGFVEM
jgi:hypothetical protein